MRSKVIFMVLTYPTLRVLRQLRISPLGCVPQQYQRLRMINDYTYSGANPSTIKAAPPEDIQWGCTFN